MNLTRLLATVAVGLFAVAAAPTTAFSQGNPTTGVWMDDPEYPGTWPTTWPPGDTAALATFLRTDNLEQHYCTDSNEDTVAEWYNTHTGGEWWIRQPGVYAADGVGIRIWGTDSVLITYQDFADPLLSTGGNIISAYYSLGEDIYEADAYGWFPAGALNTEEFLYDPNWPPPWNEFTVKLWTKIAVSASDEPGQYVDDFLVHFATSHIPPCSLSQAGQLVIMVEADTCVNPPSGIISWWPGDGNANDIVDDNHGTLQGGTTFGTGMVDQAFTFDGTDDYVDYGDVLNEITIPFTIETWINTKGADYHQGIFWSDDTPSPDFGAYHGFWLYLDLENFLLVNYGDGTGASGYSRRSKKTDMAVSLNTWTYVAAVVRGPGDMSLYINGEDAGGTYSGSGGAMVHNSYPARLGLVTRWGPSRFNGSLDEISIYNRALSGSEIQAIYNSGSAGKCKQQTGPNTIITAGPGEGEQLDTDSVFFAWTGVDDVTPVENLLYSYKMDDAEYSDFDTATSRAFTELADGAHTFMVRAMDEDMNIDPTPATRDFIVWTNIAPVLSWLDAAEVIPGVTPDTGVAQTTFTFEVIYSDLDNDPPLAGYPQVLIDYEGDGLLTGPKDAIYSMWPTGTADYVAGRRYLYTTTLPVGSTYRFAFIAFDQPGDSATGEAAGEWIDGPVVETDPVDLYLYASDITFSNPSPAVGDTFFVSGTIHNNSGTDFTDVPVEISDKFGTVWTAWINLLPAHGTATVTQGFRYELDGYYTFRFTVDPQDAITEWNEINNSAARGLVVGDPELPGFIRLIAQTTTPVLPRDWVTVSGRADYFVDTDSLEQVSGATVTVEVHDYQSFTTYTNDNGDFSIRFRAPVNRGEYEMNVSITDFTLSADTNLTLSVVSCLQPLPDLICNFTLSRVPTIVNLDDTTTITSLYVYNLCDYTAYNFWLHLYKDGVIVDSAGPVASLGPQEAYYPPEWQGLSFQFSGVGYHSLSCIADLRNAVAEDSEGNNQATSSFFLWCDKPDFAPAVPYPQPIAYVNQSTSLHARIYNHGGIAIPDSWGVETANSFAVRFRVTKDLFAAEDVTWHTVGAFGVWAGASFQLEFPEMGQYWVAVTADPDNLITECNEGNNETGWWITVTDPRPNLGIGYEDVTVSDETANENGQLVDLGAVVHNKGNATATNVAVVFRVDSGQIGDTVIIPAILPYASQTAISSTEWSVDRDSCVIAATADPANVIVETNEFDNSASVPAVFEFYPYYGGACPSSSRPMFDVCAAGEGEPVTIYARAQTSGAFNIAGPVAVAFEDSVEGFLGTVFLNDFYHHHLSTPTASMTYAFSGTGWHKVTATVDWDSDYPECNENNSHTEYIWIGFMPDLMVRSEYVDPNPLNPDPAESVTISATIYNIGHAVADNVKVVFLVDQVLLGDTVTIASIPAPPNTDNYASITATEKWEATDLPTNMHIVRIIADPADEIPEENEDNNEATRAVIVGAAPDLWVNSDGITFSNYYPGIGFPTTITATIHNGGGMAGSGIVDFYYVDDQDTIPIGTTEVLFVSPGDSIKTSLEWIISIDSTDVHVAIVSVDPQDFDLTNNHAQKMFRLLLNGDCNCDFILDALDVVCLTEVVFRGGVPSELCPIDTNCDNVLDVLDVVTLIDYVFRDGPEPCELVPLMLSEL